ncbi:MAG: exo-alpha-sialidase, partial [Victivallales bacterium]|nr:exo-alpha-sialidase [Victivallales bacterium]
MRKAQILGTGWLGDGDSAGYHGWPTLIRCADGRLLAACSGERLAHVCPCGRVVIYESADNGATWSAGRILTDG